MKEVNKDLSKHRYNDGIKSLIPEVVPHVHNETYSEASKKRTSDIWESLKVISVDQAVDLWLKEMQSHGKSQYTVKNYASAMTRLIQSGLVRGSMSLSDFYKAARYSNLLSLIRSTSGWKESTKQSRCAAFISFTKFLAEKTESIIPAARPNADTFKRIRSKVATEAMTRGECRRFIDELHKLNPRDALICKLQLQGCKRIGEVLSLHTHQISKESQTIIFKQLKAETEDACTVIKIHDPTWFELIEYIGERSGIAFITSNGKQVSREQVARNYAKAGRRAGIGFHVRPHCIRTTGITILRDMGRSEFEIQRVSGHASASMVSAYDKRSAMDNPSQEIDLVSSL